VDDVEGKQDDPREEGPIDQEADLDLAGETEDQDGPHAQADDTDDYDAELGRAIEQAYPDLLHRVQTSYFADWHQKHGEEVGLAHKAVVAAIKSLRKKHELPDNMLAYLVTIAKRLAQKDWYERGAIRLAGTSQIENIEREDYFAEPGEESALEDDENNDDVSGLENHPNVFASISGLPMGAGLLSEIQAQEVAVIHAAIDHLPPRQQQVFRAYLSKGQSFTHRELAEELEITEKNFQMTLARAGESVCKYMRSKGFEVLERPDWGDVG
jgi:RNA polymerase sigma factor (sigma-70 family)